MHTLPYTLRLLGLSICLLVTFVTGCTHVSEPPTSPAAVSPNQPLLDALNRTQAWVRARKTKPIWAKRLDQELTIHTLEGPVRARAGDFLCRGEIGEMWPQKANDLEKRYTPTETVDGEGWRRYAPRTDTDGVLAARVDRPFQVQAKWGKLSGKAGDYVVKNFRDRDVPYPDDVWIVDQRLFSATYEMVAP